MSHTYVTEGSFGSRSTEERRVLQPPLQEGEVCELAPEVRREMLAPSSPLVEATLSSAVLLPEKPRCTPLEYACGFRVPSLISDRTSMILGSSCSQGSLSELPRSGLVII